MSVTLRFQSTGAIPGSGEPITMRGPSLTIGRGDENDLVLPDPDRMISKRHCAIENHNGNIVVVDLSTNGTYLNYGKVALGNVPTPLNDGDILSMGGYEILVDIASQRAEGTPPKPESPRNPGKTDLRDFTDEPTPPEPVLPKPPPRPKTGAPKVRPQPTSPDEFEVPPHLRADPAQEPPKPKPGSLTPADRKRAAPNVPPASSPISDAARLSRPSTGFGSAPSLRPPSLQEKIFQARPPRVTTPIPDDWDYDDTPPQSPPLKADRKSAIGKRPLKGAFGRYVAPDLVREIGTGGREAPTPPVAESHAVAPRGHALFRVPRLMWAEIAELAELRLGHGDPMTVAMRAELERTMVGRGETTDEHPVARMGNRMQARLFGDDRYFSITALGSETQDIALGETAEWDWRVTPLCEGHGLLTLRLTMLADIEGNAVTVDAEALHTSVEITVKSFFTRPRRFVRDNWRWMLGSSGIGAAAALYALLRGT